MYPLKLLDLLEEEKEMFFIPGKFYLCLVDVAHIFDAGGGYLCIKSQHQNNSLIIGDGKTVSTAGFSIKQFRLLTEEEIGNSISGGYQ